MRNTALITFVGGDAYTKEKHIRQILREENEDYGIICEDYDELDMIIPVLREQNIKNLIILHEDYNLDRFERAAHAEYDHLFEKVEVLQEQFFRLYEDAQQGQPAAAAPAQGQGQTQNQQGNISPSSQMTMQIEWFPKVNFMNATTQILLADKDAINNIQDVSKINIGLIVDKNKGYWFPNYFKLLWFLTKNNKFETLSKQSNFFWASLDKLKAHPVHNKYVSQMNHAKMSFDVYSAMNTVIEKVKKDPKAWIKDQGVQTLIKEDPALFEDKKAFVKELLNGYEYLKTLNVGDVQKSTPNKTDETGLLNKLGLASDVNTATENLKNMGLAGPMIVAKHFMDKAGKEKEEKDKKSGKPGEDGNVGDTADPYASFIAFGEQSVLIPLCGSEKSIYKGIRDLLGIKEEVKKPDDKTDTKKTENTTEKTENTTAPATGEQK